MRNIMFTKTKIAVIATLGLAQFSAVAQAETVLNVATAGSQNMVDYVKTYLAPKFEAMHPDVKIKVVGTGPGDAGSHKIPIGIGEYNCSAVQIICFWGDFKST